MMHHVMIIIDKNNCSLNPCKVNNKIKFVFNAILITGPLVQWYYCMPTYDHTVGTNVGSLLNILSSTRQVNVQQRNSSVTENDTD